MSVEGKNPVSKAQQKSAIEPKIFRPRIHGAGLTDIGGRHNNEDSFYCNDPLRFYLVADGMGGHAGGEMASLFTSVRMCELLDRITISDPSEISMHNVYQPNSVEEPLRYALWFTNEELHRAAQAQAAENPTKGLMGTTLVGVWIKNNQLVFMNIGDSRAYMIWDGGIQRITHDNSVLEEMAVCEGGLSREEAEKFAKKNILSRSLGNKPKVVGDFYIQPLRPPARILLCTDGLHGVLDQTKILQCCQQATPEKACEELIAAAKIAGELDMRARNKKSFDNITAVVIDIGNYAFPVKRETNIDDELSVIED